MYKESPKTNIKHIDFMILDTICLELALLLSFYIRYGTEAIAVFMNIPSMADLYQKLMILIVIIHLALVIVISPYSGILKRGIKNEIKQVVLYNSYIFLGIILFLFISQTSVYYSRIIIILFLIVDISLMLTTRICYKKYLQKRISKETNQEYVLIIATLAQSRKIIKKLEQSSVQLYKIIGIALTDTENEVIVENIPVIGNGSNVYEYVRTNIVDEIFVGVDNPNLGYMINTFISMGVTVHICVGDLINAPKQVLNMINGISVITASANTVSTTDMRIKRMTDIFFGIIGTVLTVFLTIVYAPILWLVDPGPVFFRQKRVGRNGRVFTIWKFRTMYIDAEKRKEELLKENKMTGHMFKMDNDPRIIGAESRFSLGQFMRKTSLDEMPQFFNILAGTMSLVGTRPPTVQEYEQYALHHKGRLGVKPGLTGMWQVSGRSEITDFEEVVELDKYYIDNFSLMLDFKIILRTIKVVLGMDGSM